MTETVSPEMVALARRLYADGATLDSILRRTGIKKLATLYRCVDGQLDDGSGTRPEPLLRRRPGVTRARPRRGTRVALITRLWRTAESQVSDIEGQPQPIRARGRCAHARRADAHATRPARLRRGGASTSEENAEPGA
jgi:hypothetical protein